MSNNKTGKYFKYALGEIILVLIGILFALQINNWNSNRIDNINFEEQVSMVLEELEANHLALKNNQILVVDSIANMILTDKLKLKDYLTNDNYLIKRYFYLLFDPKFSSKYFEDIQRS